MPEDHQGPPRRMEWFCGTEAPSDLLDAAHWQTAVSIHERGEDNEAADAPPPPAA